jgi:hypothetical protein
VYIKKQTYKRQVKVSNDCCRIWSIPTELLGLNSRNNSNVTLLGLTWTCKSTAGGAEHLVRIWNQTEVLSAVLSRFNTEEVECLLGCCAVQCHRNWRCFRRAYCFHYQGETTRCKIPEDSHLNTRRSENLKSQSLIQFKYKIFPYELPYLRPVFLSTSSNMWDLRFSRRRVWRWQLSGTQHRVISWKQTAVSEVLPP